jgi:hypothetical protein
VDGVPAAPSTTREPRAAASTMAVVSFDPGDMSPWRKVVRAGTI